MKFSAAAVASALVGVALGDASTKPGRTFAVLRFNNKGITQGRVDPIVSPGKAAGHSHVVMGGSNFGLTSTGADLMNSACSNAKVKGDNSAYWFPQLYFHDQGTGKFESVDVDYVNVYYFFEGTNDTIEAFPTGLQMLSGNPSLRTPPATVKNILDLNAGQPIQPVQFTCPRSTSSPPSYPVGSDGTTAGMQDGQAGVGFPDAYCDGLYSPLRMDIHFPSCYNPSAGLTNYKNNMAWPHSNGMIQWCDPGQIHVPHIFLEVYWDTDPFKSRWTQGTGSQPFTLSNGDATGYSAHADFLAAWDTDLLKHIIDTCDAGDSGMDQCAGLTYGLNTDDCTIPNPFPETVTGILDALPGNNPLSGWTFGPAAAAPPASNPPSDPAPSAGSNAGTGSGNSGSSPAADPAPVQTPPAAAPPAPAAPATTPAPQGTTNDEADPNCVTEIETVWETVYVTESTPAQATQAPKARRHAHDHGGHLLRHRSPHHRR